MSRLLTLALILGAAIALGSVPSAANGGHPNQPPVTAVDLQVDFQLGEAHVSILADPGSMFFVFDVMGAPLAEGIIADGHVAFPVPVVNNGPEAATLKVRVNNEEFSVTDPNWEWN